MGFQASHKCVRRDFKDNIGYEEYCQSNILLVAFKMQIFRKIQGESIRYVNTNFI